VSVNIFVCVAFGVTRSITVTDAATPAGEPWAISFRNALEIAIGKRNRARPWKAMALAMEASRVFSAIAIVNATATDISVLANDTVFAILLATSEMGNVLLRSISWRQWRRRCCGPLFGSVRPLSTIAFGGHAHPAAIRFLELPFRTCMIVAAGLLASVPIRGGGIL